MADTNPAIDNRPFNIPEYTIGTIARPRQPIQPADPVQTQFGPADPRHYQTLPTGLAPDWTELDRTSFTSPRLSLP